MNNYLPTLHADVVLADVNLDDRQLYDEAVGPPDPHRRLPHGERITEIPRSGPGAGPSIGYEGSRSGELEVNCWCERLRAHVDPGVIRRGETWSCGRSDCYAEAGRYKPVPWSSAQARSIRRRRCAQCGAEPRG